MDTEQINHYITLATEQSVIRAPKILGAILTLVIGLWVIKYITRIIKMGFEKSRMDITVSKFLASLVNIGLKIMLLISVASMFGIQTTSFIALLGAAGLAIGMSVQGALSNFAGGILILLFKPYKVGDLIEAQGIKGHVAEIGILNTIITTLESNTAVIPNGPIINDTIINLSTRKDIRVDINVGIAYDEDIDTTRKILEKVIAENTEVIQDHKGNGVYVSELADSSVNLIVRTYTSPEKYRAVYFGITEACKKALDKSGISIPFPHRVIHSVKE